MALRLMVIATSPADTSSMSAGCSRSGCLGILASNCSAEVTSISSPANAINRRSRHRIGQSTPKGYLWKDFEDAFARYVPERQ